MKQNLIFSLVISSLVIPVVLMRHAVGQELGPEFLRSASSDGRLEDVKKCIEAKVDVNVASRYGVTPLAVACDHGHLEVAQALLEAGANPNTKDKFYGFTPQSWAIRRKNTKLVELLLKWGAEEVDSGLLLSVGMQNETIAEIFLASAKVSTKGIADAYVAARRMKVKELEAMIAPYLNEESRSMAETLELIASKTANLESLVGTYKTDGGSRIVMSVKEGVLQYSQLNQETTTSLKDTDDKNVFEFENEVLTFEREGELVTSLEIKKGEVARKYTKVVSSDSDVGEPLESRLNLSQDFPFTDSNWPNFRGVLSRGISESSKLPTAWNATENKNIAWKAEIPGLATSSPIVWGDRVVVTTARQEGDQAGFRTGAYGDVDSVKGDGECSYQVLCFDRDTGKLLWQKECVRETPKVKRHLKGSHANPTPATDGSTVVASFGGAGIYCLDLLSGDVIWKKDLGKLDSGWFYDKSYQWGFASSPYIFESYVILQCDHQDGAFIAALDLKTGQEKWRTERDDIPTWSSPVAFLTASGMPLVVVSGTKACAGYNARTGEEIWKLGGFSEIVVPTPQVTRDLILLTSGYRPITPIVTMSHEARGTLVLPKEKETSLPFFWVAARGGPYMPTPLIRKDRLYVLNDGGILSCYKLDSGQRLYRQRLRGDSGNSFTASVVASGEHLYCTSEAGTTFVVSFDDQGTIVSENHVDESVLSTPAISGDMLFVRGEKHLFAIKTENEADTPGNQ